MLGCVNFCVFSCTPLFLFVSLHFLTPHHLPSLSIFPAFLCVHCCRCKHYQSRTDSTVKVTVKGEEGKADLEGFKKKLIERAKIVQAKREKHEEDVRPYLSCLIL